MNSHQIDIVRLAWARALGLPDDAFLEPRTRVVAEDDDAEAIDFVVLDGRSALTGPSWAIARADGMSNETLATRDGIRALAGHRAGRCAGPTTLAYADDVRGDVGHESPLISHDLGHVLALESAVPPDDAAEADIARKRNWFTVMDDADGEESAKPVSSAGYVEFHGFVADMGVLTASDHRRRGYGFTAARLATNDAIDAGLIPQWQAHVDNLGGRLLGDALGYTELGLRTQVRLTSTLEA
ncbi:GNAT family N-acetyltransferase [Actinomycetes bacterium M1A6_2h]